MSQIAMTIIDTERALHGKPHGSFTDRAVAALAADPETIAEFETALKRFPHAGWDHPLAGWHSGVCEERYDAGICIVDLGARIVFLESTYSLPGHRGSVLCRLDDREFHTSYHVSKKWRFSQNILGWEAEAKAGRQRRLAESPLDVREILYGAVCPFLVNECLAVRSENGQSEPWTPPGAWTLRVLTDRLKQDATPSVEDAVAEIHARWLMTPRADLRNRAPRELLLASHDHIDLDLQDRCGQWARMGECPLPVSRDSAAYRYAGFGTHEIVTYYEMVRHLAWECWEWVVQPGGGCRAQSSDRDTVIRHLEQVKQDWLNSPDLEDFSGATPALVIERERRRIPWAVSAKEAMIDEDCPLCQMMAESAGPVFWHLDGSSMDYDFPFSWHATRDEWEEEQREWAEHDRAFEEEMRRQERDRSNEAGSPDRLVNSSPWEHSGSGVDPRTDPPLIVLFGLACHVAELEENLKGHPETPHLVGSVNHLFANLRKVVDDRSQELLEPVVEQFCNQLQTVLETAPELAGKCIDLQRKICELAARLAEEGASDEDAAF